VREPARGDAARGRRARCDGRAPYEHDALLAVVLVELEVDGAAALGDHDILVLLLVVLELARHQHPRALALEALDDSRVLEHLRLKVGLDPLLGLLLGRGGHLQRRNSRVRHRQLHRAPPDERRRAREPLSAERQARENEGTQHSVFADVFVDCDAYGVTITTLKRPC
jgi:hypothetical protein